MSSDKTKKGSLKNNLPIIQCVCGHEILLLPDLQTLGKAIEEHVMEHEKKHALTQEETYIIQDDLIRQALKLASKIKPSSVDIKRRFSPKNKRNKRNKNSGD